MNGNLPEYPDGLPPELRKRWLRRQILLGLMAIAVGLILLCLFSYLVMMG